MNSPTILSRVAFRASSRGLLSGSFAVLSLFLLSACAGDDATPPPPQGLPNGNPPPLPDTRTQCSQDLRAVLAADGSGNALEFCSPDQGCAAGRCVPACEAAGASQGSIGCSFYAFPPEGAKLDAGSCFAAFIANTWVEPLMISATYDGTPIEDIQDSIYVNRGAVNRGVLAPLAGPLEPGDVAIVFLSSSPVSRCPGKSALDQHPNGNGTAVYKAFRLETTRPTSAYQIFPYDRQGGAQTTASLLLPISSWTKENMIVDAWPSGIAVNYDPLAREVTYTPALAYSQLIAASDTTVVIAPRVGFTPGERGVVTGGSNVTYSLRAGEVLQIVDQRELTGSLVSSSAPIGLFGGIEPITIPADPATDDRQQGAADLLQQQIPSLATWGSAYTLAPPPSRALQPELTYYRIVGGADGTELTYESSGAVPLEAPQTINRGEVYRFQSRAPILVRSQDSNHPFYTASYLTGADSVVANPRNTLGDPEFLNLVPSAQYLDHYVFFLDPSYDVSSLTVVRNRGEQGFAPVALDCAGEVRDFKAVDEADTVEVAYVDMSGIGSAACGPGRHEAISSRPFGIYVWGMDDFSSYAYPGGQGLRPIYVPPAGVPLN